VDSRAHCALPEPDPLVRSRDRCNDRSFDARGLGSGNCSACMHSHRDRRRLGQRWRHRYRGTGQWRWIGWRQRRPKRHGRHGRVRRWADRRSHGFGRNPVVVRSVLVCQLTAVCGSLVHGGSVRGDVQQRRLVWRRPLPRSGNVPGRRVSNRREQTRQHAARQRQLLLRGNRNRSEQPGVLRQLPNELSQHAGALLLQHELLHFGLLSALCEWLSRSAAGTPSGPSLRQYRRPRRSR
jgi:hypothetical protein